MSKAIGPNFANELTAYGLAHSIQIIGTHFAWHSDGTLEFFSDTPAGVQAAVEAVYAAHDPTTPEPRSAAAAMFVAGLAITSTGTPAVNGTYACDEAQQDIVTRVQAYITKNNSFPGGMSTLQLRTAAGGIISLPSVAVFQAVGSAIADFVAQVDHAELVALAGGSWVAPSNSVTIA